MDATRYPLHTAAAQGKVGEVRRLLQSGSHGVNDTDDSGWTPLMRGVSREDVRVRAASWTAPGGARFQLSTPDAVELLRRQVHKSTLI